MEFNKSKSDLIIAASKLSPSATLSYKIAEQEDLSATVQDRTQQTVTATATTTRTADGGSYHTKHLREGRRPID